MNRKVTHEYNQLVKLGIPESTARIIVVAKYMPDSDEAKDLITDEIDFQKEIKECIVNFKIVEEDNVISEK